MFGRSRIRGGQDKDVLRIIQEGLMSPDREPEEPEEKTTFGKFLEALADRMDTNPRGREASISEPLRDSWPELISKGIDAYNNYGNIKQENPLASLRNVQGYTPSREDAEADIQSRGAAAQQRAKLIFDILKDLRNSKTAAGNFLRHDAGMLEKLRSPLEAYTAREIFKRTPRGF